ncbi:sialidase family protein [Catellatospora sp. NPDC049609]|uniref:sialidase family protein n=1 Tax=Catellatospora sp. NPDC049609 TaxID=3155505 RepID=UPI00342C4990
MGDRFEVRVIARAADGDLAHFPDVARLPGGRLLAAYREGAGHVSHEGRIRTTASDDGGRTWSTPVVAVDGPYDDRDPKLAVLAGGAVLLSHFTLDWSSARDFTVRGVYVRRSDDGGHTWSAPAAVGTALRDPAAHGAVAELPGGDLLIPLYGMPRSGRCSVAAAVRSTDGGRTWPAASETVLAARDGVSFQEPTLTVLPGGGLVALLRTTGAHAWLARSADGGHTWSAPHELDLPASSHHVLALDGGGVLVTYGDTSGRFSPRRITSGRLVRHPERDWTGVPDLPLYDSGVDDQANPSSAELPDGRLLTLSFDVTAGTVVGVVTHPGDYPA